MVETNKLNGECAKSEDLVAYLYGEMPDNDRGGFEGHLLECSSCTDHFASLSLARLEVYEWHRDEFLPMPTPEIVIPYAPIATEHRASFFEKIRAAFALPTRFAAVGFAAALFVVFAIALFVFNSRDAGVDVAGRNTANSADVPVVDVPSQEESSKPLIVKADNHTASDSEETRIANAPIRISDPKHITSKARQNSPVTVRKQVVEPKPQQAVSNGRRRTNPPRLNNFEDEEDTSLRLADLMADIDTDD